jgi:Lipoate-protein ligase B
MSIDIKISKKRIPYKKAMVTLEKRVQEVEKGRKKEFIWILEHPLIFTAGIRSKENENF